MMPIDQANAEAIRYLLSLQELVRAPKREQLPTPILSTSGQAPTIIIAAPDSGALDKQNANLVLGGAANIPQIRRALDQTRSGLASLPGWVHFSAGTYDIDMSLQPSFDAQDLMITGVGFGYSNLGTVFNLIGTPASSRPFLFEGTYSVFRDFGIKDNTDYTRSVTGIVLSEGCIAENVKGWTSGHFLDIQGSDVYVNNCEAMFSGFGGDTGKNNCINMDDAYQYVRITNNVLTGTDGWGFWSGVTGTNGTEVSVLAGNVIDACEEGGIYLGAGDDFAVTGSGVRWCWAITGNSIEGCGDAWTTLADLNCAIGIFYPQGVAVVGNTVTNCNAHGLILAATTNDWSNAGEGCLVVGNQIARIVGYPIWLRATASPVYLSLSIRGNYFASDGLDESNHVQAEGVVDFSIESNTFVRGGIVLVDCARFTVDQNHFIDTNYGNDGGTVGMTGIVQLDDSHSGTLLGNKFAASEGIVSNLPRACFYLLNGSDDNRIHNNHYLGEAHITVGPNVIDYGVWFAATSGAANFAVGNNFALVSTASIQDDVTGNVVTWPGGGNDNW